MEKRTSVIAEIGSAWRFGDDHLKNAWEAIEKAKACRADCIKFQWTSGPRKMERRRNVPEGSYEILAWPKLWLPMLHEKCEQVGIEFLVTVFLPDDVETVNPYVKRWKVASLEREAFDLLAAMRLTEKQIIASNGMENTHWPSHQYTRLHCTVAYPAPLDQLNLRAIRIDLYNGYSDHSGEMLTGALAVACGASMVEVHFRLDDTPPDNPDYVHSHTPEKLREYISNIRKAELMLGDGIKRVMPCEEWALQHKVKA